MFKSNMKEDADNKVEINDIEPDTFEKLLNENVDKTEMESPVGKAQ